MRRIEPDIIFKIAEVADPFMNNEYLLALMRLPPAQRKIIARQAAILCGVVDGLDTFGALEILAKLSPHLEEVGR